MADIAVGDVTHLVLKQRKTAGSQNSNLVRLSFGNGALTYPAGGIPLSKAKMGCPVVIESMVIVDQGVSGYKFQYDQSAEKLIMMQAPAQSHAHDFLVKGGTAAAGTDALNIKTVIIGKESATDATSLAADTATKGGVLSATLAAAALAEASTVAIAAQVIEVEIIGY